MSNKFSLVLKCVVFALVLGSLFVMSVPAQANLSKSGSIAILTKSDGSKYGVQHAAAVAAIMTSELIANGYKVVNPDTLAAIRKNKAAEAALNGDVDAIIRLSKQYGYSTTITAQLKAGRPVLNEFQLYTGTSSLAIMVMSSGGQMIYADTVMGKQVGYTSDEAAQKSIEAAAKTAVQRIIK